MLRRIIRDWILGAALLPICPAKWARRTSSEVFDLGEMGEQIEREQEDRKVIRRIRQDVQGYLFSNYPEHFNPGTSTYLGGVE